MQSATFLNLLPIVMQVYYKTATTMLQGGRGTVTQRQQNHQVKEGILFCPVPEMAHELLTLTTSIEEDPGMTHGNETKLTTQ